MRVVRRAALSPGRHPGRPGGVGAREHRGRSAGRRQPDPRNRPRPRGRGDRLAGADVAAGSGCDRRQGGAARRLPRGHRSGGARGAGAPARHRHGSGARGAGAPRARLREVRAGRRETAPPPRYSEAGLVRRLEELGIGRPSTYAAIVGVLQDRHYVALIMYTRPPGMRISHAIPSGLRRPAWETASATRSRRPSSRARLGSDGAPAVRRASVTVRTGTTPACRPRDLRKRKAMKISVPAAPRQYRVSTTTAARPGQG